MFNKAMRTTPETTMATRLKETDVVIIGLGAAGGVAVLPLRRPASTSSASKPARG